MYLKPSILSLKRIFQFDVSKIYQSYFHDIVWELKKSLV